MADRARKDEAGRERAEQPTIAPVPPPLTPGERDFLRWLVRESIRRRRRREAA